MAWQEPSYRVLKKKKKSRVEMVAAYNSSGALLCKRWCKSKVQYPHKQNSRVNTFSAQWSYRSWVLAKKIPPPPFSFFARILRQLYVSGVERLTWLDSLHPLCWQCSPMNDTRCVESLVRVAWVEWWNQKDGLGGPWTSPVCVRFTRSNLVRKTRWTYAVGRRAWMAPQIHERAAEMCLCACWVGNYYLRWIQNHRWNIIVFLLRVPLYIYISGR